MQFFFQQLLNALQIGSVYALIALGYTMVYGVLLMINFAHGDIFMASTYMAFFVATWLIAHVAGWPPVVDLVLTMLASMFGTILLAVVIERVAYKPLRSAPRMSLVITSLGVGLLMENLMVVIPGIGPQTRVVPSLVSQNPFTIGGITTSDMQIVILVVAAAAMLLLDLVVRKTRIGMAMRAIAWDRTIVPLMGIPLDAIVSLTFALGAAVAAVGGTLYGMAYSIDPYMGIRIGWWAFIAAVVGGIGNIRGAMIGGFLLGLVEIFTPVLLRSSSYRDMVAFSLLLILLIFRPTGILGRPMAQKV